VIIAQCTLSENTENTGIQNKSCSTPPLTTTTTLTTSYKAGETKKSGKVLGNLVNRIIEKIVFEEVCPPTRCVLVALHTAFKVLQVTNLALSVSLSAISAPFGGLSKLVHPVANDSKSMYQQFELQTKLTTEVTEWMLGCLRRVVSVNRGAEWKKRLHASAYV
jgi:hypothetical protein